MIAILAAVLAVVVHHFVDVRVSVKVVPYTSELTWRDGDVDHEGHTQERLTVLDGQRKSADILLVGASVPGMFLSVIWVKLCSLSLCPFRSVRSWCRHLRCSVASSPREYTLACCAPPQERTAATRGALCWTVYR